MRGAGEMLRRMRFSPLPPPSLLLEREVLEGPRYGTFSHKGRRGTRLLLPCSKMTETAAGELDVVALIVKPSRSMMT